MKWPSDSSFLEREKSADSSNTSFPLPYSNKGLRAPAVLQMRALQYFEVSSEAEWENSLCCLYGWGPCSCSPQRWPAQGVYGTDNWVLATGRHLSKAPVCLRGGKLCLAGWAWTRESPSTIPSAPLCLPFLPPQGSRTARFNPNFPNSNRVWKSVFHAAASFSQWLYKLCPISRKSGKRISAPEKVFSSLQKNR